MTVPDQEHVVGIPLRRLPGWLEGFAARHGAWVAEPSREPIGWDLVAADAARAQVVVPAWLESAEPGPFDPDALAGLTPSFGVLLLRRAGYVVAAFEGGALAEKKIGTRHIHGRTAAGGWSQQRYARRRDNQADEIVGAAAETADRILGPRADLQFLVTGGDRPLLNAALKAVDRRLAALPVGAHLGVGTPDARMLAVIPDRVLAVQIRIGGPQPDSATGPLDPPTG
jgi:Actinobacteria/chloroflexi VLRF1 release factor